MDSDNGLIFEDRGGSEEERIRSVIDQAMGAVIRADGDFEQALIIGDALYNAIDDILGIQP